MEIIFYYSLMILLLIISVQDIKEHMIYDWIPQLGIFAGLGINYTLANPMEFYLWGVFIGFLSLGSIHFIYKYFKKVDGIGIGDAYVFAMIGAFLGISSLYFVLLIACISALVFILFTKFLGKKQSQIPFVPFLSFGSFLYILMIAK